MRILMASVIVCGAFLFGCFFGSIALADSYTFTKANNKVEWEATGSPGFLRINGAGGAAEGTLTTAGGKVSGDLTVALDAYQTGIEIRDHHMKEKFLETGKYPTAKLTLKDQPYTDGKEGTATGSLTIKGVTKPVTVTFTVSGKKVTAKFKINISDYPSIGVPSYLGVTVANDVNVSVDASL